MATSHFVVYVIERRKSRELTFGPVVHWGAFATKRDALVQVRRLSAKYPENEYRATGYWDQRPW